MTKNLITSRAGNTHVHYTFTVAEHIHAHTHTRTKEKFFSSNYKFTCGTYTVMVKENLGQKLGAQGEGATMHQLVYLKHSIWEAVDFLLTILC